MHQSTHNTRVLRVSRALEENITSRVQIRIHRQTRWKAPASLCDRRDRILSLLQGTSAVRAAASELQPAAAFCLKVFTLKNVHRYFNNTSRVSVLFSSSSSRPTVYLYNRRFLINLQCTQLSCAFKRACVWYFVWNIKSCLSQSGRSYPSITSRSTGTTIRIHSAKHKPS